MDLFDYAITTSRAARSRRNSRIRLVENTLTILIIGLAVIMLIQYVYVAGGPQYLITDTAQSESASQKPAYRFVENKLVKS
jgi:hypothetical protein